MYVCSMHVVWMRVWMYVWKKRIWEPAKIVFFPVEFLAVGYFVAVTSLSSSEDTNKLMSSALDTAASLTKACRLFMNRSGWQSMRKLRSTRWRRSRIRHWRKRFPSIRVTACRRIRGRGSNASKLPNYLVLQSRY